jgi:hypothetical protein
VAQGSTHGVCGPCVAGDGGAPSGDGGSMKPGDAGTTTGDAGTCALYGQVCMSASDCCYGVPCTNGRCESPIQ